MPLTPDANLCIGLVLERSVSGELKIAEILLDELLGLDVAHAMDTGNTVTINISSQHLILCLGAIPSSFYD